MAGTRIADGEFSMLNSRQDAINQCPLAAVSCSRMPPLSLREAPSAGRETAAAPGPSFLDDTVLERHLGPLPIGRELVESTTSTNADLLARARERAPLRPVLRVARRQTQGRGRRGRRWHGGEGSLLFSLALPWRRDVAASAAVTLACGIAAATVLRERAGAQADRIRVKWPNDLLIDGAKVAGILVEMADDPQGARTLVIGMGINLVADPELREDIAADAGAAPVVVADLGSLLGVEAVLARREALLAELVRALVSAAQRYEHEGFAGGPAAFDACCAYRGLAVAVQGAGAPARTGILRGVDAEGCLLLESGGMVHHLNSGELSLRQAAARGAA